ncbi:DUF932 domain-containing protein [Aeromonas dhakensis]|uniref:DUF932 domain-containing protein n=1 Tax=Aeromonas dhakensis TaxID=196024 RepID=UPI003EC8F6D7
MAHLIDTMAYTGQTPWHGLGNVLPSQQSLDIWLQAAGMDWTIEQSDVMFNVASDALHIRPYSDSKVLYRSDTLAPLSVVSSRYNVVQPHEVLHFYQDLVEAGGFELETAGSLKGGRKLWALAKTGQDFRIYRIERDEEKIQDLTEREAQFWQMVQQNQQPEPDGSSDAANALSWLFPRDDGQTVDLSDSPEFNELFGELLRLRQQKEAVELQESQLKQRLQATLGEATAGLFANGKITWKRSKDRLAPDLEKLGQDHPDLLTRYVKPVPGVRRFTIQPLRNTP